MNLTDMENQAIFSEWAAFHASSKRSLHRAQLFAQHLGYDPRAIAVPVIGVVGSKGKGTASIYAAATLASQGLKVGMITSPQILTNRDRIRIDGVAIPEPKYAQLLQTVIAVEQTLPPVDATDGYLSPSGCFLVAGTQFLLEEGCTALVLEAGMGGISDEISLFDPTVVVATAIFGEHLDVLGPTISDVAKNKLGIVRQTTKGFVTVSQLPEVGDELRNVLDRVRVDAVQLSAADMGSKSYTDLLPKGLNALNACAGIEAATKLLGITGRSLANEPLRSMLASVSYPGRLSLHHYGGATVLLDAPVSRAGLQASLDFAKQKFGQKIDHILVSLPQTKDLEGFVDSLRDLTGPTITFVNLQRDHLHYPAQNQWPWDWIDEQDLLESPRQYIEGNVLAVGTVSFVTSMMHLLGARAERLFGNAEQ